MPQVSIWSEMSRSMINPRPMSQTPARGEMSRSAVYSRTHPEMPARVPNYRPARNYQRSADSRADEYTRIGNEADSRTVMQYDDLALHRHMPDYDLRMNDSA